MFEEGHVRATKRARIDPGVEDENGTSPATCPTTAANVVSAPFERDDELWLEDGNIVLVAGGVGFCVYRGLLAGQSEVFRDMLALPLPASADSERFCGLPIVRLSDSKEDLRHLLDALFPRKQPLFCRYTPPYQIPAAMLSAVIRLAHKYGFAELERQGLACLGTYYTRVFDAWQRAQRDKTHLPFQLPFDMRGFSPVEVIHIARLTGTPSLLPIAFYRCATKPKIAEQLVKGHVREDGTVVRLDADDVLRCIRGQRALVTEGLNALAAIFDLEVDPSCESERECLRELHHLRSEMEDDLRDRGKVFAPLKLWHREPYRTVDNDGRWIEDDLCVYCLRMMKKRDRDERRRIWDSLPEIFALSQ